MNATIVRFGFPATLIADYQHWAVLLRPSQPTLGSLILAAKSQVTAFAALDVAAFAELAVVTSDIEAALGSAVACEKLNYLMLMMVDPHVHFHVIPRYAGVRDFGGKRFVDAGWPKLPALGEAVELSDTDVAAVSLWLRSAWAALPPSLR